MYGQFVQNLTNSKKWNVRFSAEEISDGILNKATDYIQMINALSKPEQIGVITALSKHPIDIKIYVAFIDYCFPGTDIWDYAPAVLRLGWGGGDYPVYNDTCRTPDWTSLFLQTVHLSPKDQGKFAKIIEGLSFYDCIHCPLSDDLIETALDCGLKFVKHYDHFDKWLTKKLKESKEQSPQPLNDTPMSVRIAEWITEESTNINKAAEIVEVANQVVSI
jgi:hypothetical protein